MASEHWTNIQHRFWRSRHRGCPGTRLRNWVACHVLRVDEDSIHRMGGALRRSDVVIHQRPPTSEDDAGGEAGIVEVSRHVSTKLVCDVRYGPPTPASFAAPRP